ncbi:MAG: polymerase sigma factor FliA, partial [Frankiaceae bacterium]|nr:polymerase sigma factor FliA [Frankiaceae bacterium]
MSTATTLTAEPAGDFAAGPRADNSFRAPLSQDERGALVEAHLSLANQVLYQIALHFPRHADRDELAQAATLGLVEAAYRYDPARGVPFERWAVVRIRGAILDSVRSLDFAPRSLRAASRQLEDARASLTVELRRTPTDAETAKRLGMTPGELGELTGRVHRALVLSLDAPSGADEEGDALSIGALVTSAEPDVCQSLESRELLAYLGDAVRLLPERLRVVVTGYFIDGRTSAELADELGVTESRVSQLRSEALAMLRHGIESQYRDDAPEAAQHEVSQRAERRRDDYAQAIAAASTPRQRLDAPERPRRRPAPQRRSVRSVAGGAGRFGTQST